MNEETKIIELISTHLGVSLEDARIWFCNVPISAFGWKTARQMIFFGEGEAVRKYIEHLGNGGYA